MQLDFRFNESFSCIVILKWAPHLKVSINRPHLFLIQSISLLTSAKSGRKGAQWRHPGTLLEDERCAFFLLAGWQALRYLTFKSR